MMTRERFRAAFAPGRQVRAEFGEWLWEAGAELPSALRVSLLCDGAEVAGTVPASLLHDRRFRGQPGEEWRWRSFSAGVTASHYDATGRGGHEVQLRSRHRYLSRLEGLVHRLESALAARDARLHLTLLGVSHTDHFFPDQVPALRDAELVTLELPTTPVKAYMLGAGPRHGERLHIRNVFWLDILAYFRRRPPRLGTHGCNVNPHVRYLRTRLHYRQGFLANDFEAPPAVVASPSGEVYTESALGGAGDREWTAPEVLEALPAAARETYRQNRIVHVDAEENPFGPARHLVVYEPPPGVVLQLEARALEVLAPLVEAYQVSGAAARSFVMHHALEGFLLSVNDNYLVETLLLTLARAVESGEAGEEGRRVRAVHVAGVSHLPHLRAYLTDAASDRLQVSSVEDPRFPLHPAYSIPPFFARELERTLAGLSLEGGELRVCLPECEALLRRWAKEEDEDLRRRLLLKTIWTRDQPSAEPPSLSVAPAETPLRPSRAYLEHHASRLDRDLLEYALADQPVGTLEGINARLAAGGKRGQPAAISQELREIGFGYEELHAHPYLGPYARAVERLWLAPEALEPDEVETALRAAALSR